ncbi:hypothetical protein A2272_04485 [Candidatus Peregrinibacteria bacterium RIFOXYA12_FULL_33_12]|nr:MAG: hypothetical protein A2263_00630 [Candidatus Peregrinibacteria bacterium RIFOXYA2_FULL_33_21]OGJ45977.1 MAG: hypothetical protein A2272_04485 [Candidatus Peregrinibacteria bacterium RIFOXYA12_FULL_33_12]OGJ51101.1 MAG: hypothetical protein A2307_06380 [Candidatus Peregrinibacteria bacterium RIFOXYB2_FULL_33_20]
MDLHEILKQVVEHKASDVHFKVGYPPVVRLVNGSLLQPKNVPVLSTDEIMALIKDVLDKEKLDLWTEKNEIDVSYFNHDLGRFRVNVYADHNGPSMAVRVIPKTIPDINNLGLPDAVKNFCNLEKGLVLVTGPTGSGKSTTLAGILDRINVNRACHILTIEDPIEFLHSPQKALITQRELYTHTHSFVSAIKSALREDPDVIMVGEMRDKETIAAALTLAETGHLVFSTVHTIDAVQTIDRIIDVFPHEQQPQVRTQLASTLQGIVSQALRSSADLQSRVLVCEVLLANSAVKNCIKEAKIEQIYSLMQLGKQDGMQTVNDSLQKLKNEGKILLNKLTM